jgi:hypothetical protein
VSDGRGRDCHQCVHWSIGSLTHGLLDRLFLKSLAVVVECAQDLRILNYVLIVGHVTRRRAQIGLEENQRRQMFRLSDQAAWLYNVSPGSVNTFVSIGRTNQLT